MECKLNFRTVIERDMDLLFIETISTENGFARMIVDKTKWAGSDFVVKSIEHSRADAELGESDITVIIVAEGKEYGILIEDKIDAPAMKEQHQRYIERGKKGCRSGDYSDFDIIIICPEKYYNSNEEAKKYEHHIFYEECKEYYRSKKDEVSKFRLKQVQKAIDKAKKSSEPIINEAANAFYREYRDYQRDHYKLDLRTSENSNGWWARYATRFGKAYILHKIGDGYVDLTFTNADRNSAYFESIKKIAERLNKYNVAKVTAESTGKSGALRITVPKIDVTKPFEKTSKEDLNKCFEAVSLLNELAEFFLCADNIKNINRE